MSGAAAARERPALSRHAKDMPTRTTPTGGLLEVGTPGIRRRSADLARHRLSAAWLAADHGGAYLSPMGDLPARPHPQVGGLWRRWTSLLDVGVDGVPDGVGRRAPKLGRAVLEAAADPAAVRTHPLTLRFASRELEGAFKEEYERESLRHIRFAVA